MNKKPYYYEKTQPEGEITDLDQENMPRNDSNQYYARWCCYRRPIRAAFARKGPFNSSSGYEENVARLKNTRSSHCRTARCQFNSSTWTCYFQHVGRKLATAIDYGSPQSIEISEIGAVMHQMSCERLSLSLFSRFACLLARLKTCVLLIN